VIADCGRIGVDGPPHDLLAQAAAIVLLTGDDLGQVVRLRERVPALAAALDRRDRMSTTIGVVVIAGHKRFHTALAEVGEALGHGKGLLNVVGGLAYDPRAARQLRGEWGGRLDKSLLVRTARDVAGQLAGPLPALSMPLSGAARGPASQPGRGRHAGRPSVPVAHGAMTGGAATGRAVAGGAAAAKDGRPAGDGGRG
jgi:hypothetical protein